MLQEQGQNEQQQNEVKLLEETEEDHFYKKCELLL
jgi:hypothetical protein